MQKYCESDDINFLTAITQVDQKIVVKLYAKMEHYEEEILINCKNFIRQKLKACGDVDKIQNFREFRRYLPFDQIFKIVWQTITYRNIEDVE